ncbi:hypothetical protein NK6_274 [Bradyrhizobium diazoefficiens]|uniref:Uncharacterized protein n=1 Tax=Bradyrhizobium diazoefficiens TaxID=1355477 RepID=A0A0E4FUN1_9BRAD|nr:hypothetical protein NK6_274 [Bradyrhizobium diazoefficiens]
MDISSNATIIDLTVWVFCNRALIKAPVQNSIV